MFIVLANRIESVLSFHLSVCSGSYLESATGNSHHHWCWNLSPWDSGAFLKMWQLKWACAIPVFFLSMNHTFCKDLCL